MSTKEEDAQSTSEEKNDVGLGLGLPEDPEDYYPPSPPPTAQSYTLQSGKAITLHLVGYSPLEAHHLWNGSRVISEFFETHVDEVRGKTVLELGAGAGLPSIVAAVLGARKVLVTDFPDADLVANMWKNIDGCDLIPRTASGTGGEKQDVIAAEGFVWGFDPRPLLAHLPEAEAEAEAETEADRAVAGAGARGFDVLILADLLFRHSEHGRLVDTIEATLARRAGSKAFVFFTSYRPWLRDKDMAFFDVARERGFEVEQILERKMESPLFENDPGDVEVQKTCTGFTVRWPAGEQLPRMPLQPGQSGQPGQPQAAQGPGAAGA